MFGAVLHSALGKLPRKFSSFWHETEGRMVPKNHWQQESALSQAGVYSFIYVADMVNS